MKINKLWLRLHKLVPNPDCDTFDEDYDTIVWRDARPMPNSAALMALTGADLETVDMDMKKSQALGRLKNRGNGAIHRDEFDDLLDYLGIERL